MTSHCYSGCITPPPPVLQGMENVFARHHRLGEGVRRAVAGWGLQTLCRAPRWQSDSLTVVEVPEGHDSQRVVDQAFARYNLSLGIGLDRLKGKVFRIGHLVRGGAGRGWCLASAYVPP